MKSIGKKLLSFVMVLALMVGFAPGMGLTAQAETAIPTNGSDAGNGLKYYVGYALGQQGGNYQAADVNSGGASLFDGDPATKACIGFEGSYSVEFSYASEITPHNYYFRTGGDTSTQTKRNPSAWKLEGKNTDNTWTVLDEKSEQTYTTDNNTEVKFGISNNTAYQTFRLTITAINSSGYDAWPIGGKPTFQLSEVYMSGTIAPASSDAGGTSGGTTSVTVSTADEFKTAVGNGGTITLGASFELPLDWGLGFGKSVTIDLNGKTITVSGFGAGYTDFKLETNSNAALTIKDSVGGGEIILPKGSVPQQGGVLIANSTSLTLESGTLHFTGDGNKGIIFDGGGSFTMTGGMIDSVGDSVYRDGGSVAISGGTVKGGFTGSTGDLTITGGSFSFDPTAYLSGDYAASKTGDYWVVGPASYAAQVGETSYATFAAAVSAWNSAANDATLKLLSDVTISSTINVTGTKTLDLNGHGIKATGTGYSVITVGSGANLTLNDSRPDATHKYTIANPKSNGAGLAVVDDDSGATPFTGGYITGGNSAAGGGIYTNGGTIHVNGGTIIGNQTTGGDGGGGICVRNGTLSMTGGAVTANYAYLEKGAQGGGISLLGTAQFAISGGVISYNWADGNNGCGGGVQGNNSGSDTISGGEVFNNYAKQGGGFNLLNTLTATGGVIRGNIADNGGGVCAQQVILSGSATIQDNLKLDSAKSDICLYGNHLITLNSVLSEANSNPIAVGIFRGGVGVITDSTNPAFNDPTKFVSDDASYAVGKNSSGQLALVPAVTVTFDAGGGSAVAQQKVAPGAVATKPTDPTKDGYTFGGWYTDADCATAFDFTTSISADTTLYAKWTANHYTVGGPIKYGSYTGDVEVSLLEGGTVKYTATVSLTNGAGEYSFAHVPTGTYTLRAVWTEGGKETALQETLNVW